MKKIKQLSQNYDAKRDRSCVRAFLWDGRQDQVHKSAARALREAAVACWSSPVPTAQASRSAGRKCDNSSSWKSNDAEIKMFLLQSQYEHGELGDWWYLLPDLLRDDPFVEVGIAVDVGEDRNHRYLQMHSLNAMLHSRHRCAHQTRVEGTAHTHRDRTSDSELTAVQSDEIQGLQMIARVRLLIKVW